MANCQRAEPAADATRHPQRPGCLSPRHPLEHLAGLVERVTFHNPDNGFCVLRLKVKGERDLVTLIGYTRTVAPLHGCRVDRPNLIPRCKSVLLQQ